MNSDILLTITTKLFLRSLNHKMAPRRHMLILSAKDLVMEFSSLKTGQAEKPREKKEENYKIAITLIII